MRTPTMKTRPHQLARTTMCLLLMLALPVHAETATLQHDNNGNVTQRTTPLGTTTYQYDALERLINESGPAKTQSFIYDENGNRLKDGAGTTNNYTIDPNSNRFVTTPFGTPTYDAAGRMTADGTGRTFGFNQAGQLYQVKQGSTLLATYYYDANGLRSRKVTTASAPQGAQTILFEYDEERHLISEISGTGAPLHTYAWRDNTPVAQIDYQPSRKILSFDPDHLNTPRAAMDETGKVVWRWESDAFGTTLPDEDPDKDGNKTTINLRFGGWYADVESGLFYAMFRYYSPPAGRFITPDPIGLAAGINPFVYVNNQPMGDVDPLGLWATDAHDYFIDEVFGNLDPAIRDIIKQGSAYVDGMRFQDGANSFMHAMSSDELSPEESRKKMCKFIKEHMGMAEDAKNKGTAHYWFYMGMALHPVMDTTSPAHSGFQKWHGIREDGAKHGPWPTSLENLNVAKQEKYRRMTVDRMRNAVSGQLKDCGC